MYNTKSTILTLFLFCCMPVYVIAQQDTGAGGKKIFYFIDADCTKCSAAGYRDTSIWIATNNTYSGEAREREALIKKFQDILEKQYHADPALTMHTVFRFLDSEEQVKTSYSAKEAKMKSRKYVIIKIEF